ncbi:MAG: hypothetical protein ACOCXX_05365, partial [Planctomycetota bacterium]
SNPGSHNAGYNANNYCGNLKVVMGAGHPDFDNDNQSNPGPDDKSGPGFFVPRRGMKVVWYVVEFYVSEPLGRMCHGVMSSRRCQCRLVADRHGLRGGRAAPVQAGRQQLG